MALSREIVQAGCRYAVCSGSNCASWEDSFDFASVLEEADGKQGRFVMTTSHENETLKEIAGFFVEHTAFEDFVPAHLVIIGIGLEAPVDEARAAVIAALEG